MLNLKASMLLNWAKTKAHTCGTIEYWGGETCYLSKRKICLEITVRTNGLGNPAELTVAALRQQPLV